MIDSSGTVDYTDVNLAINAVAGVHGFDGALTAFPANPFDPTDTTISDALAPIAAAFPHPSLAAAYPPPSADCTGVTAGQTYIDCVGKVLATFPTTSGGFANLLPTPPTSTPTINNASTLDLTALIGSPNSFGIPAGLVNVVS